MNIKVYIAALLILASSCNNPSRVVNAIAAGKSVESAGVGIGGSPSNQYRLFEQLKTMSTEDQLLALTTHPSPAVATYASYGLLDKGFATPSTVFATFINDPRRVPSFQGCIISSATTASLFYQYYWNEQVEYGPYSEDGYSKLTINDTDELRKMDSMILFSETADNLLISYCLSNRVYPKHFNSRIEELAFDHKSYLAESYVLRHLQEGNEAQIQAILAVRAQELNPTERIAVEKDETDSLQQVRIDALINASITDTVGTESQPSSL